MKSYTLLVLMTMWKMIEANEPILDFEHPDTDSIIFPAILFTEKNSTFFIIPNKNYSLNIVVDRKEALLFTCPASRDEIKSLKLSEKLQTEGKLPTTATSSGDLSNLQIPSSPKNETKLPTSASMKEPQLQTSSSTKSESKFRTSWLSSILPLSKDEPDLKDESDSKDEPDSKDELDLKDEPELEDDSFSSADEDFQIPPKSKMPQITNNDEENEHVDDYEYHNDHYTDLTGILNKLASPAGAILTKYSPKSHCCKEDYKPQKSLTDNHCGRLTEDGESEWGHLFAVSYKFWLYQDGEEIGRDELFVYAKCFRIHSVESIYVIYKIIPSVSTEEPKPINYDDFDPRKAYHIDVYRPYYMGAQKQLFRELDKEIADDVIPQRLIPAYSIAEDYSRGTVVNDYDIFRPQWRSKAKIWDDLSRVIFNHGEKLQWIIYTGTVGTLWTKNKERVVVQKKGLLPLTIPLFWWTFIMKTDSKKGEGIIIGMLNVPKTTQPLDIKKYKNKLCNTKKTCVELGWEKINKDNSDFVVCCEVTGDTTSPLIGNRIELYALSLESEIANETEQDRVSVNTLLQELSSIGKRYKRWRRNLDKKKETSEPPNPAVPASPNGNVEDSPGTELSNPALPSSPNRDEAPSDTESPNVSPPPSPDHTSTSPDRLDEANVPESKSSRKGYPSFAFVRKKLPSVPIVKNVIAKLRPSVPT